MGSPTRPDSPILAGRTATREGGYRDDILAFCVDGIGGRVGARHIQLSDEFFGFVAVELAVVSLVIFNCQMNGYLAAPEATSGAAAGSSEVGAGGNGGSVSAGAAASMDAEGSGGPQPAQQQYVSGSTWVL